MQINIDEIGITKIRGAELFLGVSILDDKLIYFAPLDQKGGPHQRWMVIEDCCGVRDEYIMVFTTEEMKVLCRSMKNYKGGPIKANKEIGYRFLVRSGKLRMKIRDGCAGCRRFWGDDYSEGQCSKCHRCYACCGKKSVPYSCESHQEAKKGIYVKRKH